MAVNLTFLADDKLQDATITATTSSGFQQPWSNIQNPIPDKVLMGDYGTSGMQAITFDLGANTSLNAFAVINTNLSSGATWKVIGRTSAQGDQNWGSGDTYNSGSQSFTESGVTEVDTKTRVRVLLASLYSCRYWRFEFTDSNNSAKLYFGRIIGCACVELSKNYTYGWSHAMVDMSQKRQVGSFVSIDRLNKYNELTLTVTHIPGTEKQAAVLKTFNRIGIGDDFVLCLAPETAAGRNALSFYGQLDESVELTQEVYDGHRARFVFRETPIDQYA